MSALVHHTPAHKLTLSEVPARTDAPTPPAVHTDYPQDITDSDRQYAAIALAVAGHLSTRAATVVGSTAPGAFELRAAYLLRALGLAQRCPLCAPDLRAVGCG